MKKPTAFDVLERGVTRQPAEAGEFQPPNRPESTRAQEAAPTSRPFVTRRLSKNCVAAMTSFSTGRIGRRPASPGGQRSRPPSSLLR